MINKLVPGKFKDEMGGVVIIEFVGLRAKMYGILTANTCKKTTKGISTIVKEKEIQHEDYKNNLVQRRADAA